MTLLRDFTDMSRQSYRSRS